MDNILIKSVMGTMLAGEEVFQDEKSQWIGIKLSQKSNIRVFVNQIYIESIYHIDGTIENRNCTLKKEEVLVNSELISEEDAKLIRVTGGMSYRGKLQEPLMELPDGYWLSPTTINEIIIYIPKEEVEEIFS